MCAQPTSVCVWKILTGGYAPKSASTMRPVKIKRLRCWPRETSRQRHPGRRRPRALWCRNMLGTPRSGLATWNLKDLKGLRDGLVSSSPWGYPKLAGWFREHLWMMTGGYPVMTKRKPPYQTSGIDCRLPVDPSGSPCFRWFPMNQPGRPRDVPRVRWSFEDTLMVHSQFCIPITIHVSWLWGRPTVSRVKPAANHSIGVPPEHAWSFMNVHHLVFLYMWRTFLLYIYIHIYIYTYIYIHILYVF